MNRRVFPRNAHFLLAMRPTTCENPGVPVRSFVIAGAAAAVLGMTASVVLANELGPLSGSATVGCGNGCHGDARNPAITLEAPASTDETPVLLPIRVSVEDDTVAGGGGFMLEASWGRIVVPPDQGIRNAGKNEATHDGTQPLRRSWSFDWVLDGPVAGCAIDLTLAAMAADLDGTEAGDSWGRVSSAIAIVPTADTTPPETPAFVSPPEGTIVNSGRPVPLAAGDLPATIVLESTELRVAVGDEIGVRDVVFYDADVLGSEVEIGPATFERKTGHWIRSWTTEGITPGPHTIRAVATDCAGNVSEATIDVVAF